MAHEIPKIQYQILELSGNSTSLSPTLTGMTSTAQVAIGMKVVGTGIPAGARVLSKTVSTVTLDDDATLTTTGVALEFYRELEFEFPPIEDGGETSEPKEKISISLNGTRQVLVEHVEGVREMRFRHVSNLIFTEFQSFMRNWAGFGQPFRYFDDKTLTSFVVYEAAKLELKPRKISHNGASYVWEFPFTVRRVLDSTIDEVSRMQSFAVVRPSVYPHIVVKNTTILVDTSTPRSLQLPEPAAGLSFRVKDAVGSANANNISMLRYGAEKIETVAATKLLTVNFGAWEFTSDGVDWFITSF